MWLIVVGLIIQFALYVRRLNSLMLSQPREAVELALEPWTDEQIRTGYQEYCKSPLDVKPFLPPKTGNRYIIVGGNGFVGAHHSFRIAAFTDLGLNELQAAGSYCTC
jgi:hypothetical protein